MTNIDYLISLRGNSNNIIRDTWVALGSLTCTSDTKVYIKDAIYKISIPSYENPEITSELDGALIYCTSTYSVNNTSFSAIDWETATIDSIESSICFSEGIVTPYFKCLLTKSELAAITEPINNDLIPFSDNTDNNKIQVSDEETMIILGEIGVPFIRMDELEYSKDIITRTCFRPVLDVYYKHNPIIEDKSIGTFTSNQKFDYELPTGCHDAIVYYTIGRNAGTGGGFSDALTFWRQEYGFGGGATGNTGNWGGMYTGKRMTPGWVNLEGRNAFLQNMETRQGFLNYFRRQHVRKYIKDHKLHITGYSSIGGNLEAKLLKHSYDWDDIIYENLSDVRNMCTAKVMRNLGMLRSQVKNDLPNNIDYKMFIDRAKEIEDPITKKWSESSRNLMLSIMRGGMN